MPTKICIPTVIRRNDHLWDPGVVEYDVVGATLVDGEPVFHNSGQRIALSITGSTTMADIQTAIEADATTRGWLS